MKRPAFPSTPVITTAQALHALAPGGEFGDAL